MSGIYRGPNGSATADALNIDGDKGDLTISNSGLEWAINPDTVDFSKMQNISTDVLLGRATSGSGDIEEITCTAAGRALLDDANASAQRTTLGVVIGTDVLAYDNNLQSFVNTFTLPTTDATNGFVLTTNGAGTLSLTSPGGVPDGGKGDITVSSGGIVWTIDDGTVTTSKLGGDITTAGKALLDDADASAQRTTLGLGTAATTASTDYATAAQGSLADTAIQPSDIVNMLETTDIGVTVQAYDADTAKTDVVQTFTAGQRGEVTTLTDGANISSNFNDSNFFSVTLAGNRTLDNPSNLVAGQSGSIFITQDATGSRTLAYGSYWDFANGTAPSLSKAANSVDRLDYVVRTSTSIHAVLSKAWS